jgi:hypothetical protein
VQEIGMFPFVWGDWGDGWHGHWDWDWDSPWWWFGGVSGTIGSVMGVLLAMGLVCLVLFIAPRPVERVDRQLVAQPWACLGAGLAAGLGFLPALALLTLLTCCLLILVYPFLFLVVGWFVLLGYATVARRLGWYLSHRFGWNLSNPYLAALIGVLVLEIWSIIGHLLALPGLVPFAWMFEAFDFAVGLAALLVGTGAVVLARFGAAPGYWDRGGVPPAPPVPQPAEPGQPAGDLPLSASGNPPE